MNLAALQLHEAVKVVSALSPRTPSTSSPRYVSLKNFGRMMILIHVANGETVTGSAITLLQAKTVGGGSAKALAFTTMWAVLDTEDATSGDTLIRTTVVSNTFTTDATDDKSLLYLIEIDSSMLDVANGFDCLRVGTGNGTATTLGVLYFLYPVTGNPPPTAIVN